MFELNEPVWLINQTIYLKGFIDDVGRFFYSVRFQNVNGLWDNIKIPKIISTLLIEPRAWCNDLSYL